MQWRVISLSIALEAARVNERKEKGLQGWCPRCSDVLSLARKGTSKGN